MALANGKSRVKCGPITEHTKTAIYITETLTKVCLVIYFAFYICYFKNYFKRNIIPGEVHNKRRWSRYEFTRM